MSLVDGGLSKDTFDYAQDLARVDANEDDFHVHLFSHDRRAACASEDQSRHAVWVTLLPFALKLHGPWYMALKRPSFRTQLSHHVRIELTGAKRSSKKTLRKLARLDWAVTRRRGRFESRVLDGDANLRVHR